MPMYDFRCPACQKTRLEYRRLDERNDAPVCACGTTTERAFLPATRRGTGAYRTPIEMYSLALDTPEGVNEFRHRNPGTAISDDPADPMFGVPVVTTRQEKLRVLAAEGWMERN